MRHSLALILLLPLTACSYFSKLPGESPTKSRPAAEIYAAAMDDMNSQDYDSSVKQLQDLQSRYPYGRYAQQAQLEMAYAYYKAGDQESALSAADRFIKQYPNSPHVDYAYYLKGLISFNEDLGYFGDIIHQDMSDRDPQGAHDSFDSFKELITRFPDSKYVPDAKLRMQYLIDSLARHEIHVANYYLNRKAYVAALNRAKTVLIDYPQSPQTRDALQIMIKAYDAMGMAKLRDDAQRVLDLNTKGAKFDVKAGEKPWWKFWE
jgi:outer membrane protein assembly factor BamD